jgi:hypothetical protein
VTIVNIFVISPQELIYFYSFLITALITLKIYGPVREGERWRIRSNQELEEILRDEDIVRFVKFRRLAKPGQVERTGE